MIRRLCITLLLAALPLAAHAQQIVVFTPHAEAAGDVTDGLISCWTFDNISGSTVVDDCGSADLTLEGDATTAAGQVGNAVTLDGNDWLSGGDVLDIGTSDRSFTFWINTSSTAAQQILNKAAFANPFTGWDVFMLNNIYARFNDGSTNPSTQSSNSAWNDGAWHCIMVVMDRDSGVSYYADGDGDGSWALSRTGSASNATNFSVGRRENGSSGGSPDQYYTGLIDEVRVYNRVLSEAEHEQICAFQGL